MHATLDGHSLLEAAQKSLAYKHVKTWVEYSFREYDLKPDVGIGKRGQSGKGSLQEDPMTEGIWRFMRALIL